MCRLGLAGRLPARRVALVGLWRVGDIESAGNHEPRRLTGQGKLLQAHQATPR
jgi:hypothetical protein